MNIPAFFAALKAFVAAFVSPKAAESIPMPPQQPPEPVTAPPMPIVAPTLSRIVRWANEIEIREGGHPNDPNMRNKNPGNLRYSAYTKSFKGFIGCTPNDFCVFDTREHGHEALCQFLTDACEGKLIPYQPTMSIMSFTHKFAEPPDGQYGQAAAKAMGLLPTDPISMALL